MIAMPAAAHPWSVRVREASSFASARRGRISFAVMDESGRIRGSGVTRRYHSASVVKVMLMVAYLRRAEVRNRRAPAARRARCSQPMVTRSDNITATRVRNIVGNAALAALARRAGMRDFATARSWGDSRITPADQVRFIFRVDRLVPARHRAYALGLMASVVGWQRWGIPRARPPGWDVYFKGGWRRDAGARLVNQVALLRHDDRRIAVAILTDGNPKHRYGTETVRGVATRLLDGLGGLRRAKAAIPAAPDPRLTRAGSVSGHRTARDRGTDHMTVPHEAGTKTEGTTGDALAESLRAGDPVALVGYYRGRSAAALAACSRLCAPERIGEALEQAFAEVFEAAGTGEANDEQSLDRRLRAAVRSAAAERFGSQLAVEHRRADSRCAPRGRPRGRHRAQLRLRPHAAVARRSPRGPAERGGPRPDAGAPAPLPLVCRGRGALRRGRPRIRRGRGGIASGLRRARAGCPLRGACFRRPRSPRP